MKALISPLENNRICQIEPDNKTFDIAQPLYWIDCPNECKADWTYSNGEFLPPQPYIPTADENKTTAIELLKNTDWAELPSVSNPAESNPYLNNKDEFIAYRSQVRAIAVDPVAGNITWPVMPQGDWITL